jgi:hypothetical protein
MPRVVTDLKTTVVETLHLIRDQAADDFKNERSQHVVVACALPALEYGPAHLERLLPLIKAVYGIHGKGTSELAH